MLAAPLATDGAIAPAAGAVGAAVAAAAVGVTADVAAVVATGAAATGAATTGVVATGVGIAGAAGVCWMMNEIVVVEHSCTLVLLVMSSDGTRMPRCVRPLALLVSSSSQPRCEYWMRA